MIIISFISFVTVVFNRLSLSHIFDWYDVLHLSCMGSSCHRVLFKIAHSHIVWYGLYRTRWEAHAYPCCQNTLLKLWGWISCLKIILLVVLLRWNSVMSCFKVDSKFTLLTYHQVMISSELLNEMRHFWTMPLWISSMQSQISCPNFYTLTHSGPCFGLRCS